MPKPQNHKTRMQFHDEMMDTILLFGEENPGAFSVVLQLTSDKSDPDSALGPLGTFMSLDSCGIYGSNLWILFNNCCKSNLLNVVTALRAVQLGLMPEQELWDHIDTEKELDCEGIYNKVKERLPNFNPENKSRS